MKIIDQNLCFTASDLSNYLGCKHLSQLDWRVANEDLAPSDWVNPSHGLLQQKGQKHEDAYVAHLQTSGLSVCILTDRSVEASLKAMKEGYDIITQATLELNGWTGRADILKKVEGESDLGNWHYEIEDTKLATETKAAAVLQLCLYTELLGYFQGRVPENMRVIKPGENFPSDPFRFSDFEAYYRFVKAQFENVMNTGSQDTYPLPVSKCGTCVWWQHCDQKWHDDDHLSLIANIGSNHIKELERQQFSTLQEYADEPNPLREDPESGSVATYEKIHDQAQVQLKGRRAGSLVHELLPLSPLRGFNRLPEPSSADIYFDIEGDHFYKDGGLEYLLGFISRDEPNDELTFKGIWAQNRSEEKAAFEQFMEHVMMQWDRNPGMHIYHYAPYEPSAIKRMASRHATFQEEVDRLLRAERFVDIYSVIKESLIASVESYSLKDTEKLASFERTADLRLSGIARRNISVALELDDFNSLPDTDIPLVEEYNQDDVLATQALHDWLEDLRTGQIANGEQFARPVESDGSASDQLKDKEVEALELYEGLIAGLDEDPSIWDEADQAKWLLAHQIDFYRREDKSQWWEFFRLNDMESGDLLIDRKGIAGLEFIERISESRGVAIDRYSFPQQEISFDEGKNLYMPKDQDTKIGSVEEISLEKRTIDIKKTRKTNDIQPDCLHIKDIVGAGILVDSLFSFARNIIVNGIDGEGFYRAGRDLLLRKPPRLIDGPSLNKQENESTDEHALRVVLSLNNGVLPIQGPPGTGKTYLAGGLIAELVQQGKKVGVTAISHKVIRNLLDQIAERAEEKEIEVSIKHKPKSGTSIPKDDPILIKNKAQALEELEKYSVVGGVAWLWADNDFEGVLDYLFVDEAGQMSLTNVATISRAAKNIILLGDPQQLEQPTKGEHPEGADISALDHILQGRQTMPGELGLFLDTTWRLNPGINEFTSRLYYEGKLGIVEGLQNQVVTGDGAFTDGGLFYVPVIHEKNKGQSIEEASTIKKIVGQLLAVELSWTHRTGEIKPITQEDILIVAPYNAQVSTIKSRLPELNVGTVDKFQGQQAPIVIYSMTASSPEDAPRGMNFLFNPHRLNVATSRAQCLCILVASPQLFEANCNTVEQMKMANGLCMYREMATIVN